MGATFCSFCGRPLPPVGTFCPYCGAARASVPPGPGGGPAAPSGYAAPPSAPVGPGYLAPPLLPAGAVPALPIPNPATRASDLAGLSRVELAAILSLVTALVGVVVDFTGGLSNLFTVTRTPTGTTISLPPEGFWIGVIVVEAVLGLGVILLYRAAFRDLARVDRRFASPASFALVAFIGVILAVTGAALTLDALYRAVQCAGAGHPLTSACLPLGSLFGGIALVVIGGIAALVGYLGILIGVWRLGTRFDEAAFKVGAILLILPLLNIVGAILILIGARAGRRKVTGFPGAPAPPGFF